MNWKAISLAALQWRLAMLGAIGGVGAAAILTLCASFLPSWLAPAWWAVLPSAAYGLGLGLLLSPVGDLLNKIPGRMLRAALAGALLGLVAGACGGLGGWYLENWLTPFFQGSGPGSTLQTLGILLTLGLAGSAIALASGFGAAQKQIGISRAKRGTAAGFLGGLVIAVFLSLLPPHWSSMVLLTALWGAQLVVVLFWWEWRHAKYWLRVLMGPGEERIIPLAGSHFTLGCRADNDIPLIGFNEIHPYHCNLMWKQDHFDILDSGNGGLVFVNFRQIQTHTLKQGDLVRIGSALLQYGES